MLKWKQSIFWLTLYIIPVMGHDWPMSTPLTAALTKRAGQGDMAILKTIWSRPRKQLECTVSRTWLSSFLKSPRAIPAGCGVSLCAMTVTPLLANAVKFRELWPSDGLRGRYGLGGPIAGGDATTSVCTRARQTEIIIIVLLVNWCHMTTLLTLCGITND